MPTITNTAPRVFNLPQLDVSPDAIKSYVTRGILDAEDVKGGVEPFGPVTIGPPPFVNSDGEKSVVNLPFEIQISKTHLKILRSVYGRSFGFSLQAGLQIK
jgi:hypothetical protein